MIAIRYSASNPTGAPTLILAASLGTDRTMWRDQVGLLPSTWNVVTFDLRGHGETPLSTGTPSIDDFADDVISIADDLGVDRLAFCGLSIGGAIGQSLAARYPERLNSLVLASTGMTILSADALTERAKRVVKEGTGWIADLSMSRWFAPSFLELHPEIAAAHLAHLRTMDPRAYADACLALADFDGSTYVSAISTPTLVISGEQDHATPPKDGASLASAIPEAEFRVLPGGAHLCNVEQPVLFTGLLRGHVEANECQGCPA